MRCARYLREPTTRDWDWIVRVARYLCWTADTCVTISTAPFVSGEPVRITCWEDSGWAALHISQPSCSGVLLALSDAVITSWVRMHATQASSSGEAELYAIGSGFIETVFNKHLLEEMGHDVRAEIRADSYVARSATPKAGTTQPTGSPNLSHMPTLGLSVKASDSGAHVENCASAGTLMKKVTQSPLRTSSH